MKVSIARWFIKYFTDLSIPKPTGWNAVQLVGIQGKNKMGGLDKLRWVGKIAAAQKWFLKMVIGTIEWELKPTPVISVGVGKAAMIEDITGLILDILSAVRNWGLDDVFIGSADIKTAFNLMRTPKLAECLHFRGVSAHSIAVLLRERTGNTVTMEIPTAGETGPTPYTLGGIQGGTATPLEFRTMVEAAMEPVVVSWRQRGI